jgi:hypothetical protein
MVHHCRNSSILSLLSALLALCQHACVSAFSILGSCFKFIVIFPPMTSVKKDRKEEKIKTVDVTFFLDVF